MKISAIAFLVAIGLSGCVTSEDYGFRHVSSTDCSSEGRQRPISNDSGAGISWTIPNTARWCSPRGGLNPAADPIFAGSN
jgi:hypothetical protein